MRRLSGLTVIEGIVILVIILLIGAVLIPVQAGHGHERKTACLSNLKQMATGQLIYAGDADDRVVLGPGWVDALMPYTKNEAVFKCSEVKSNQGHGYAFNKFLGGALMGTEHAAKKHMVYDTRNLRRNVCEFLPDFPVPGRHKGFNNVAYADSHAQALRMDPEPPK
jgi:prepilin-type processing-associated H-X9-DG protein